MTNDCSRPGDDSRAGDATTAAEVRSNPSVAVVERIATETGCSPLELPPLNDAVDADALDRLVGGGDGDRVWPTVVFSYANHGVRISADGRITLSSLNATTLSAIDEWTHVSVVDTVADGGIAARTVSALADRSGREPARVRSAIGDVVDLDAVARLGCRRGNGASRSGGAVLFSVLGCDVVVESNGRIAVGSTLDRLKRSGGNVLVVGSVPDDLADVASANLLGAAERDRRYLFALVDRDDRVVTDRLDAPDPAATSVVDYATISRSAADVQAPTETDERGIDVADEPADLDELGAAIEAHIGRLAATTPACEPGELRLCVDSLRPVFEERGVDGAIAFLKPICASVRDATGLAHYMLPVDRERDCVDAIESLFDATIELRVGRAGPQQRWHLHESGFATGWFALRAVE